jgi:hypothetical protein
MAGYLGTKAVFLSTTAASVTGNVTIGGDLTVGSNALFVDESTGDISFYEDTGTTAKLTWDASAESLGIGTSSPQRTLHVHDDSTYIQITNDTTGTTSGDGFRMGYFTGQTVFTMNQQENDGFAFSTNNTERMRIDSSGNLLVGKTAFLNSQVGHILSTEAADGAVHRFTRANNTNTQSHVRFYNNGSGTQIGSITTSGGGTTAYNTSSDYRLKEDVQPMVGASDRVQSLRPVNFAWKTDGSRVDGFIAHEVQTIVPEAICGTKDAMMTEEYEVTPAVYEDVVIPAVLDDEGNEVEPERTEQRLVSEAVMGTREVPDYQGIDQSKLVPLLTAALQEALTEIADLKARVTALEAN